MLFLFRGRRNPSLIASLIDLVAALIAAELLIYIVVFMAGWLPS